MRFFRGQTRFHSLPLPCISHFLRVDIMSEWSDIEYTTQWLLFLDEECHVWFLSYTLVNDIGPERIGTRFLMINLHPNWTKLINFRSIAFGQFFNRFFPIFILWSYSHPSLSLGNNLHHFLLRSIGFFKSNITVVWIIHDSEEVWEIFLVFVIA